MNWGDLAQLVGPPIAVLGILAGALTFWLSVKTSRAASAFQVHKEYLGLCLDKPQFSSTEQFLRSHPRERLAALAEERTLPATQYIWFLSFMLNSLEQTLEHISDQSEWRKVALSQVSYHDRAIAEVWETQEWDEMYGTPLRSVVEEILIRRQCPLRRDVLPRAGASARANKLRKRLRDRPAQAPAWAERFRTRATPMIGAGLIGMAGGVLLTWSFAWSSGSSPIVPTTPPVAPPEKTGEIVRTTAPAESLSLLPWLAFALVGLLVGVLAWRFLRSARAHGLTRIEKAGFVSPALPGLGAVWNWIKPQLSIELSDALHNLLAAGLLGLSALAVIVLALGYFASRIWRQARMIAVIALGLLAPALFFVPSLRLGFTGAILTDGRIEATYVGSLLAVGYLGFAVACVSALIHLSRRPKQFTGLFGSD